MSTQAVLTYEYERQWSLEVRHDDGRCAFSEGIDVPTDVDERDAAVRRLTAAGWIVVGAWLSAGPWRPGTPWVAGSGPSWVADAEREQRPPWLPDGPVAG